MSSHIGIPFPRWQSLALAAGLLLWCGKAHAALSGSKHDFYGTTFTSKGSCSACHIPHGGVPGKILWPRSLQAETDYFTQKNNPNYVTGATILCYDCHDNHDTAVVDNDPPDTSFQSDRLPQDVAFDDDMKHPLPTNIPRTSEYNDGKPGYYENIPSESVGYPNTSPPVSTTVSGHYVKNEPGGVGGIYRGDKLPCWDCHNPHGTTNQAFIRESLGGNTVTGKKASTNMSYDLSSRDDQQSRDMCIACHGTSEQQTKKAVRFSDVNSRYGTNYIAAPTTNVAAHQDGQTTACTTCHFHNRIVANCYDCHGFPPLVATPFNAASNKYGQSYAGGAGAHQRHLDALGAAIFDCAICHGPNPGSASWHNNGSGTVSANQVDIMGQTSWWGAGSSYNNDSDGGDATYAFAAKGGGDAVTGKVCANLACHGYPLGTSGDPGALNWTDDMVDDSTGAATADIEVCAWCHDSTPAVLDKDGAGSTYSPVKAPNIMGHGNGTAAWGAEVNGHGLTSGNYEGDTIGEASRTGRAAANKGCVVCHDATYTAGTFPGGVYVPGGPHNNKSHFDGAYNSTQKRLNDSINDETLSTLRPTNGSLSDAACVACHQRTTGSDDGMQVSSHGNTSNRDGTDYNRLETEFQVLCRSCHEPHGRNFNGASRNLHMVGAWIDTDHDGTVDAGEEARVDSDTATQTPAPAVSITAADNAVVFTSRTGTDSFDEDDTVWTQDADDVCATCHAQATGGGAGTGGGSHAGLNNPFPALGQNCMQCHDHDYDDLVATYPYDAFLPSGASDMEQFFDAVSNANNYNAVSGHALDVSAKTYTTPPDCIGCHQSPGGTGVSNECLKCHYEGWANGSTWVWVGHTNGSLELRSTATATDPPYGAACSPGTNCISIPKRSTDTDIGGNDDVYPHCLACHDHNQGGSPPAKSQLGGQNPLDIVPSGKDWNNTGVGHGNSSVSLSNERGSNKAGPPAYDCGACHSSTVPVAVGKSPPSFRFTLAW